MANSTRRGPAAVLRALLAAAWVLFLLVGIPAALLLAAGNPLPEQLPTLDAIQQAFTQPDDGSLFLVALTLIGWVAWATFALALLLEIPAQLRGVSAPRLPGLGVQQQLAATLIASIATLLPAAGAAQAMTDTHTVATSYTVPTGQAATATTNDSSQLDTSRTQAAPADTTQPSAHPDRDSDSDGSTYTVKEGDSLWRIAAERLQDPTAWRQIAEANYGRPQPGGGTLRHDHNLQPGWKLKLPTAADSAASSRQHSHVVRTGETLSEIARDELGDAEQYPAIVKASAKTVQPDGQHLNDPDVIRPGWKLTIPGEHDDASSSPKPDRTADTQGEDAVPQPHDATPAPAPRPGSGEAAPGLDSAPATAAPTHPAHESPADAAPAAPAPAPAPAATAAPAAATASEATSTPAGKDSSAGEFASIDARTAAGTGALLAAGILTVIGAMRVRQQHRRRPGQRIALPDEDSQLTELELRAVEDPLGIAHIDAALRALAAHHRAAGRPLPQLWAARLTGSHLELYLAEPASLPAPWAGTEDGIVWSIPHEDLPADGDQTDTRAPYPSLVTIGQDLEDAHLMLDLEHITTLAIDGTPSETQATLAALAVELATSTWADDLLVTLVGCLPELTNAVPTGRLRHLDRVEQLILDLEQRAEDVVRVLEDAGVPDILTARGRGVAHDAWAPEIVLLPGEIPDHLRARLHAVLHQVPRVGVAVVTGGSAALGDWSLRYDTSRPGFAQLQPAGISLRPQTLQEPEYSQVLDLLVTTTKEPVPGPSWAAAMTVEEPTLDEIPAQRIGDRDTVAVGAHPAQASNAAAQTQEERAGAPSHPTPHRSWDDNRRTAEQISPGDQGTGDVDDVDAPDVAPHQNEITDGSRGSSVSATSTSDPANASGLPLLPSFLPPPVALDRAEESDMPSAAPPDPTQPGAGGATISQLPGRPPRLQLLGNVSVLDAAGPEPGTHLGRATTLVAYLACHRAGVSVDDIAAALSPAKRMNPSTIWSLVSRTRRWLGTDPEGRPYLPRAAEGGLLRLHPDVRSDWDQWLDLVGPDVTRTDLSTLMHALQMVTGTPFSGVVRRYYGWAEPMHQEIISSIVDVAHEASSRAFRQGDVRAARTAAYIGRKADPASERMWRAALRAEYLAGGADGTRPLVDQLLDFADELAADLEPETEELIAEINRRGHAAGQ